MITRQHSNSLNQHIISAGCIGYTCTPNTISQRMEIVLDRHRGSILSQTNGDLVWIFLPARLHADISFEKCLHFRGTILYVRHNGCFYHQSTLQPFTEN
jgi:hypothetical protein